MPEGKEELETGAQTPEEKAAAEAAANKPNLEAAGTKSNSDSQSGKPATEEKPNEPTVEELIAAALEADREARRVEAEEEEARKKGDFEKLLEQREAELKTANLKAWRSEAMVEHKLSKEWASLLDGNTEAEVKAAAKSLRKRLDDEIKASALAEREEHPGTPRGQRGEGKGKSGDTDAVRKTVEGAFGLNRIPAL
jgi:hypothetical protein